MKRVVCYGDSNTWGYISGTNHLRYDENTRWTRLLQKELGEKFEIIEEGLCSRTICSDENEIGKEGRNGFTYLKPCLETHDKFDIIILMLGSNDLKTTFNYSAETILKMHNKMTDFILNFKSKVDGSSVKLIVCGISPVVADKNIPPEEDKFFNADKKRDEFNELLKIYCKNNNIIFIDNDDLSVGIDGVHLTKESHLILSKKLSKILKSL